MEKESIESGPASRLEFKQLVDWPRGQKQELIKYLLERRAQSSWAGPSRWACRDSIATQATAKAPSVSYWRNGRSRPTSRSTPGRKTAW